VLFQANPPVKAWPSANLTWTTKGALSLSIETVIGAVPRGLRLDAVRHSTTLHRHCYGNQLNRLDSQVT